MSRANPRAGAAIVCVGFAYGMVTGYPSPYVFNLNPQFTQCEGSAVTWLGTLDSGLPVITDESLSRASFYYSYTIGQWKAGYWGYTNLIPSHLTFNRTQQYPVAILISEHILQKGRSGFVPNWTISSSDWAAFERRPNVDLVYSCGHTRTFFLGTP